MWNWISFPVDVEPSEMNLTPARFFQLDTLGVRRMFKEDYLSAFYQVNWKQKRSNKHVNWKKNKTKTGRDFAFASQKHSRQCKLPLMQIWWIRRRMTKDEYWSEAHKNCRILMKLYTFWNNIASQFYPRLYLQSHEELQHKAFSSISESSFLCSFTLLSMRVVCDQGSWIVTR